MRPRPSTFPNKMTDKDRPDILILPPIAFALTIVSAIVLGFLAPLDIIPARGTTWALILGILIAVGAVAIAVWGSLTFRRAGTNVNPTKPALTIVDGGPYRFTRNPMYLGMVLFQFGLALAASLDWSLFLMPVLLAVLHYGVVLREESYLSAKFGAPYLALLARTRRWL